MKDKVIIFTHVKGTKTLNSQLADYLVKNTDFKCILVASDISHFDQSIHFGYSEYIDLSGCLNISEKVDSYEVYKKCESLEEEFGINLIDFVRADRHIGHQFVSGAKYAKSHYSESSFDQKLDIVANMTIKIKEIFSKYDVKLVLTTHTPNLEFILGKIAEIKEIPCRMLMYTKSGKAYNWAENRYNMPCNFKKHYEDSLSSTSSEDIKESDLLTMKKPAFVKSNKDWRKELSYIKLIAAIYKQVRLRRKNKKVYGNYYLISTIKQLITSFLERRKEINEDSVLNKIPDGIPFVYYPLSVEPECTLMNWAQMCNNQLIYVDWLAKCAPAGWRIVVKEHPYSNPREHGFWEQICKYPNVIKANRYDLSEEIGAKAQVIATINSTVGIQGAVDGKPVLTFHPHYVARILNHVVYSNSFESTLKAFSIIKKLLNEDVNERRINGKALQIALERNSINIEEYPFLLKRIDKGQKVKDDFIEKLASKLMNSFDIYEK